MITTPLKLLREAVAIIKEYQCEYALAGGLAASLYRAEPRVTKDVDITILADNDDSTEQLALNLLKRLNLKPAKATASQLKRAPGMNKKRSEVVMIVGTVENSSVHSGLDVILPSMAWVKDAIFRAQNNIIDFSFAEIPVITVEDLIIAKLFSYSDNISRFKDLDDLQNIFAREQDIDFIYLASCLEKHALRFPKILKKDVPKIIRSYVAGRVG